MSSVAVIDYGMGNLHSIVKALQHAAPKIEVRCTSDAEIILNADRVVFPGVGAIRDCMFALDQTGLSAVIKQVADNNRPLLGICLGMQALLTSSEENNGTDCLGLIPGKVIRFSETAYDHNHYRLKIPHMGWNRVYQTNAHPLWQGIPQNSRFYFVHSYFANPTEQVVSAAISEYTQSFTCALAQANIFAVQFHPEKSQTVGLQLLKNFLHWNGRI